MAITGIVLACSLEHQLHTYMLACNSEAFVEPVPYTYSQKSSGLRILVRQSHTGSPNPLAPVSTPAVETLNPKP